MSKTIFITGSTDGLGLEMARNLALVNKVIIHGRDKEKTAKIASELDCEYIVADLEKLEEVEKVIKYLEKTATVDVFINNAGIWAEGQIENHSFVDISRVIDINLKAGIILTSAVVPLMKKKKKGTILNVISQAALHAKENRSLYKASKYGLKGFNDSLKLELMPFNIKVIGFYPGTMKTSLFSKNSQEKNLDRAMETRQVAEIIKYILDLPENILVTELGVRPMNG